LTSCLATSCPPCSHLAWWSLLHSKLSQIFQPTTPSCSLTQKSNRGWAPSFHPYPSSSSHLCTIKQAPSFTLHPSSPNDGQAPSCSPPPMHTTDWRTDAFMQPSTHALNQWARAFLHPPPILPTDEWARLRAALHSCHNWRAGAPSCGTPPMSQPTSGHVFEWPSTRAINWTIQPRVAHVVFPVGGRMCPYATYTLSLLLHSNLHLRTSSSSKFFDHCFSMPLLPNHAIYIYSRWVSRATWLTRPTRLAYALHTCKLIHLCWSAYLSLGTTSQPSPTSQVYEVTMWVTCQLIPTV